MRSDAQVYVEANKAREQQNKTLKRAFDDFEGM